MENKTQVEVCDIDLRYANCRIREKKKENCMMISILEKGIIDPLRGVNSKQGKILLDGFKRLRCAKNLNIQIVPYIAISEDEADGILELIRESVSKPLDMIEQVKLISVLRDDYDLSIPDIATRVGKSVGWVGVRVGLLKEISPNVIEKIIKGTFSARAYLYSVKPFTRVKGVSPKDVDRFVDAIAGKKISTREVDILANAYFMGSQEVRDQIQKGNLNWGLKQLKKKEKEEIGELSRLEAQTLSRLESVRDKMRQLAVMGWNERFGTGTFLVQANLLSEGILNQLESFSKTMSYFYDRSGQTKRHLPITPGGCKPTGDCQKADGK